ncbi:hypothetical protein E8E11_006944 [Didymella keratinophila]|nr:hypothetical protein E8E11_006944 [Didymella keratinophila]
MASDDDFFVIRRFGSTNAYVMLWMQDQITLKEKRLTELHQEMEQKTGPLEEDEGQNGCFGWDSSYLAERQTILHELSSLMLHYNKYINAFSKVRSRPAAERRQVQNVRNWLYDAEGDDREAIEECEFIDHAHDLISISARTRPPLGEWLESRAKLQLSKLFAAKHVDGKHVPTKATRYSSNARFESVTKATIIIGGLAMLLAPIWWLAFVAETKRRLDIITGFMCVFISIMASATNKLFDAVAATAAYAAVLMVFMQIDPKA